MTPAERAAIRPGRCWLWHQWSRWTNYEWQGSIYPSIVEGMWMHGKREPIPATELRQRRECLRCGKVEDEKV